eukprot:Tamp_25057.p1 GENE.Tamp_25057~~Tamp_25057.p1  ORF type:complete len:203 (-),score=34.05 Tamp_25057:351-959(-)
MEAASATGIQDIESHAYMATELASRVLGSGANEHGLTVDEAGALTLYTMESELYATLNGLLSNRDRSRLKPYFSYMRLLLEARAKLPVFKGVVWRGVKKDLRSKFRAGDEIFWWAFSSTTKQVSTLNKSSFLGKQGERTQFLIEVDRGVDLQHYSIFQGEASESEVLLYPGTKLKVVDVTDLGNSLFQVHLRELPVPVKLFA